MKDYIGEVFVGIFCIIIMFLAPLFLIQDRMQKSAETKGNQLIETFVDDCRATGYFTDRQYENLITELGLLGLKWDVDINHYSQVFVPNGMGGIEVVEYVYDRNDIATELYSDLTEDISRYEMKQGDSIEVVATADIMFGSIYVQCGERIDNNIDK